MGHLFSKKPSQVAYFWLWFEKSDEKLYHSQPGVIEVWAGTDVKDLTSTCLCCIGYEAGNGGRMEKLCDLNPNRPLEWIAFSAALRMKIAALPGQEAQKQQIEDMLTFKDGAPNRVILYDQAGLDFYANETQIVTVSD